MKHSWLLLGLCTLCIVWIVNFWLMMAFIIVLIIYYERHYQRSYLFYGLLILIVFRVSIPCIEDMATHEIYKVDEIKTNYVILKNGFQKVLFFDQGKLNFDDVIQVDGRLEQMSSVHNFRQFHFPSWLKRKNIIFELQSKNVSIIRKGKSLRNKNLARIREMKDNRKRSLLLAMVFGIQKSEDASFFIVSSGMHIALFFSVLEKLLLLWFSKRSTRFISICGIILLAFMTNLSTSILRLLSFRCIGFIFQKLNGQDLLGCTMYITLLLFPYLGFELTFLLPVVFRFSFLFNHSKINRTCSSMLVLVPFQFMFYHVCNPVQIILFKWFRYVYCFLYVLALLMVWIPFFNCSVMMLFLLEKCQALEKIGFHVFYTPNAIWLIIYTYTMMCLFTFVNRKVILAVCALFAYIKIVPYLNPFARIMMLDVGQGDCTLIQLPYNRGTVMIDVMGSLYKDIAKDIIQPVLVANGIQQIDLLIITHDDMDHSGGVEQLKKMIHVKKIINSKKEIYNNQNEYLSILMRDYKGIDANDDSIITYLEVYGYQFLFMGDAGVATEKALQEAYNKLQVDVLKVGHHGSNTSSGVEFIHALQPRIALISCGRGNRYGHPSEETIRSLRNENVKTLVSANDGAVAFYLCRYFGFYKTAEREFGILYHR